MNLPSTLSLRWPSTWRIALLIVLTILPEVGGRAAAQDASIQLRSLTLESARIRYEEAKKRYERAVELHTQNLISAAQLDAEETQLRLAKVEFGRAYLSMALADPQVVITGATKYRGDDGGARVALEVVARWASGAGRGPAEEMLDADLGLPGVEGLANVIVSLKTVRGYRDGIVVDPTIISDPYERSVPLLPFDVPMRLDFGLLIQDVQEILVEFRYARRTDQRQVLLGKRSSAEEPVIVRSSQTGLEAELGTEAQYRLTLERFDRASAVYDLRLDGLASEIAFQFTEPDTGASLSHIFFPEGVTSRELTLELRLPSRPTPRVQPDQPLAFAFVVAKGGDGSRGTGDENDGGGPGGSPVGRVELQLMPRGVAALELAASNLYHEVKPDGSVQLEAHVRNTGSRALEQVAIEVSVPSGWRANASPPLLAALPAGAEEITTLTIMPPSDILIGDYEGTVAASTLAGEPLVQSVPKTLRLHVRPPSNPWLAAGLGFLLVAVLAGGVYGGVRLSRR